MVQGAVMMLRKGSSVGVREGEQRWCKGRGAVSVLGKGSSVRIREGEQCQY